MQQCKAGAYAALMAGNTPNKISITCRTRCYHTIYSCLRYLEQARPRFLHFELVSFRICANYCWPCSVAVSRLTRAGAKTCLFVEYMTPKTCKRTSCFRSSSALFDVTLARRSAIGQLLAFYVVSVPMPKRHTNKLFPPT